MINIKACSVCGEKDNLSCSACLKKKRHREYMREYMTRPGVLESKYAYRARPETKAMEAAQNRRYRDTPKGFEASRRCIKKFKSTERGKEITRVSCKKARQRYPERAKARWQLRHALNSGKVSRLACAVCGEKKTQAHHPDYSKPLDVVWLCHDHHADEHHFRPMKALNHG